MTLACAGCGRREFATGGGSPPTPALPHEGGGGSDINSPFVCVDCRDSESALRYCNRCGNESPEGELVSYGGRCAWCRSADDIPWEEPAD